MQNDFSKEQIGKRIYQRRMALKMSQQNVADEMGTSRQNISKYEREGTTDLEILSDIAQILKCDYTIFLSDTYDKEGILGEIGKEILYRLAEHGGYITVSQLSKQYMYGMGNKRINHEITKIIEMGMCVREQFTDFYDKENDGLFITAKGVIAFKNCDIVRKSNSDIEEILENIKTYEQIIGDKESYQEVLKGRELEKNIRNISYCGSYRVDYLQYLHKNYESHNYGSSAPKEPYKEVLPALPGINCCVDIIFRMVMNLSNEKLEKMFGEYFYGENFHKKIFDEFIRIDEFTAEFRMEENDCIEDEVNNFFGKYADDYLLGYTVDEIGDIDLEEQMEEYRKRYTEYIKFTIEKEDILSEKTFEKVTKKLLKERKGEQPIEWFSDEEIKEFVLNNYHKAQNGEQRELDLKLSKLNKAFPDTKSYFDFPVLWELNGLADMIRDIYDVD